MSKKVRTRFAPSPTGYLHVGGARTALFNYLYARSLGGEFILRVEDTDQERSTPGSEKLILDSLEWLGIKADEGPREGGPHGPYRQSERLDLFTKYKDQLVQEKKAYPCFCSDTELSSKQEQAKKMGLPYIYDGKCRGLTQDEIDTKMNAKEPHTVRFKVDPQEVVVQDAVQGRVKFDSKLIGDFIIIKSNGFPSYNYAVVVDDHEMEITHIIRGVGHLSNTPRQIMIHEALGFDLPVYAHTSEIVGTDKKKLSKRRGATSILLFRDLGYLPDAFVNYMSLLGWYPRDGVEYMPGDAIEKKFDIAHCSKSSSMFDFFLTDKSGGEDFDPVALDSNELKKKINQKSKLNWLNNKYIRDYSLEKIWPLVEGVIEKDDVLASILKDDPEQIKKSFEAIKNHINTIPDLVPFLHELFDNAAEITDKEARDFIDNEESMAVIGVFVKIMAEKQPQSPEDFALIMKEAGKETGAKGKSLFMSIRVASTAKMQGLELPSLFSILGWQEVVNRMTRLAGL